MRKSTGVVINLAFLYGLCAVFAAAICLAQTPPAPKPPGAPAVPASQAMPAGAITMLDGSSVWRVLHSWNALLIQTEPASATGRAPGAAPAGAQEIRGKQKFDFMTVYPPVGWTAVEFDDSYWSRDSYRAKFANGEEDERAGGGGPSRNLRQLSLRGKFTVTDPGKVKSLALTMGYRGGIAVYINGNQIKRDFLAGAEPGAPAEIYPTKAYLKDDGKPWNWYGDRNAIAEQKIYELRVRRLDKLPVPADLLRKGTNVLAVEIHGAPAPAEAKGGLPWCTCGLVELRLQADSADGVAPNVVRPKGLQVWNTNLLEHISDTDWADPQESLVPIRLGGARNGCYTARVMLSSDQPISGVKAAVSDLAPSTGSGQAGAGGVKLPASVLKVSFGRFFPVGAGDRDDALVPAPQEQASVRYKVLTWRPDLIHKSRLDDGLPAEPVPGAFQSVLVTARIPKNAPAGDYRGSLSISADGLDKPVEVPVELTVIDWTLPDPADFTYWYGLIQSPEGVGLHYEVPLWSDRHFELIGRSFDLIAQTGGKVLFIPLAAESEYGNEQSMAPWVAGPDGLATAPGTASRAARISASSVEPPFTNDLTRVERYVETAVKHLGRPTYVVCGVWEPYMGNQPPRITVRDASGKLTNIDGPRHGTPEAAALWRPLLTKVRDILARHGLAQAMLLGHASDGFPDKATVGVFHDILPEVGWETHRHWPNGGEACAYEGGTVPVRYNSGVWGQWDNRDPDEARVYGWAFKYPIPGGIRTWLDRGTYDSASLARFRLVPEQILLANRPGVGQIGADFWGHKLGKDKWELTYGRYPKSVQTGPGNKACTTNQLLYPGPDGAVPTVRFEITRENIQECEARIYLEKLLSAKPCPLPDDVARKCQAALDERTRWHRVGQNIGTRDIAVSWPYSGWQARSTKLYQSCADAAKSARPATAPATAGK